MSRREILATVELAMAAAALTAATYGLVVASYDPYAAVQWVPIVTVGAATAAAIATVAAVLFAGRAALLLATEVFQARRDAAAPPPSAATPLRSPRPADQESIDDYAAHRLVEARFGRHGHGTATLVMPAHNAADNGAAR